MPFSVKRSISSVTTEALPDGDALEQVAIRNEGDALPPRPVARREVRVDVVVLAEIAPRTAAEQLRLHRLRLLEGTRVVNSSCSYRIFRRTISWIQVSSTCSSRSSSAISMALRPVRK